MTYLVAQAQKVPQSWFCSLTLRGTIIDKNQKAAGITNCSS